MDAGIGLRGSTPYIFHISHYNRILCVKLTQRFMIINLLSSIQVKNFENNMYRINNIVLLFLITLWGCYERKQQL